VWEHVQEDIFVVVDKNNQVVFANIEHLAELLLGKHTTRVMERCMDVWSFFIALKAPESKRHVLNDYIRHIHPELDPSKATVEQLQNAKMAVAHYGCWADQGDPHGGGVHYTYNGLTRTHELCKLTPQFMREFSRGALTKAAALIRFLVRPLDAAYYQECKEIVANFDTQGDPKLETDDPEPFLSLFAFGVNAHTQRHKDTNDIHGGLAGLCTFGKYTGKVLL
jgi:hypothetical protein